MPTYVSCVSLAVLLSCTAIAAEDKPLDIGSEKVLMIDRAYFAESSGVQLKVHPPRKTGERILSAEHPWESATLNWFTVLKHDGKFKMWYECYDVDGWTSGDDTSFCYAESADGLRWTKPKLGLFEYKGDKANNILFRQIGAGDFRSRVHGAGVFLDPTAPPAERFKAVSQGLFQNVGEKPYWIAGMMSPDGLVWTRHPKPICQVFADSQYSCFWDERLHKYALYGRVGGRGRALGRSTSERFDHFDPLSLVLETDKADPADCDLYNAACFRLPGHRSVYLMCPSLYQYKPDTLDIRLACSRDGVHWTWPGRGPQGTFPKEPPPFIGLGKPGEFDSGSLYLGQGCIEVENELWFFYSGSPLKHEAGSLEALQQPGNKRVYSRAIARRDRLVSASAGPEGGAFTTPLIKFTGDRLRLNVAVRPGGSVRAAILNESGQPVPQRDIADCQPVMGDHEVTVVEWNSGADVSQWSEQPVKLRIELKDADLFGFEFVPPAESRKP